MSQSTARPHIVHCSRFDHFQSERTKQGDPFCPKCNPDLIPHRTYRDEYSVLTIYRLPNGYPSADVREFTDRASADAFFDAQVSEYPHRRHSMAQAGTPYTRTLRTHEPAPTQTVERPTVHRQGVGKVRAVPAAQLQPGQGLVWNYGAGTYEVVRVEPAGPKSVRIVERHRQTGKESSRVKRADTLVGICA